MKVELKQINRSNFQGLVIRHSHGEMGFHWAQDRHHGKYAGAHEGLEGAPVEFVGGGWTPELKKLYEAVMSGTAERTPTRPAPAAEEEDATPEPETAPVGWTPPTERPRPAAESSRRVVLLRVGIDSGSGGCQGPLFEDGSFEFVPIPQGNAVYARTYGNTLGRQGRYLADYLPPTLRRRLQHSSMHVDPEFETFTYGDPTPPKAGLRNLKSGDLLVFYAGLEGWGFSSPPALYIIGYFEVLAAGKAGDFSQAEIEALFAANMHVRHNDIFERDKASLVLVKGSPSSRLLKKAVCISQLASDRSGKPLKVLSGEMQEVFGDFGGHVSIQRSPPRRVADSFVAKAAAFVRGLD